MSLGEYKNSNKYVIITTHFLPNFIDKELEKRIRIQT